MSVFSGMNVSATALTAQRTRMDVISKNIANAQTTRTKNGQPYKRQVTVFKQAENENNFAGIFQSRNSKIKRKSGGTDGGVEVVGIVEDDAPFKLRYEPGHPDADENGYVKMSNVEMINEMVDLISAQRSYEANVTAINTSKAILQKALDISK